MEWVSKKNLFDKTFQTFFYTHYFSILKLGKTSLAKSILGEGFTGDHEATIFAIYKSEIKLPHKTMPFNVMDCTGSTKYQHKRPAIYPNANVYVICFEMTNPKSWMNVQKTFLPEIYDIANDKPVFLVGTKSDLVSPGKPSVNMFEIDELVKYYNDKKAKRPFKYVKFFGVSAKNNFQVDKLRDSIVYCALFCKETFKKNRKQKKGKEEKKEPKEEKKKK